jgi:hypothetical protein
VRRLLKWVLLTLGIAALLRKLRSRRAAPEPATETGATAAQASTDDPAEELRSKLAETREPDAPAADEGSVPEGSVEERRADVHEQGRAALDEMGPPVENE